ncbi:hypothetical protein Tco_0797103 [Tanacetum coccineum]
MPNHVDQLQKQFDKDEFKKMDPRQPFGVGLGGSTLSEITLLQHLGLLLPSICESEKNISDDLILGGNPQVNSEPPHGSNVDIPHIHECKQTLDSMVAEKDDISETIVKVDSQMMIQNNDVLTKVVAF